MNEPLLWRGMTRPQLDAAYNNSAAVQNSAEKVADYTARSARLRERHPDLLDLAYGPRPRNGIDIFRCGRADAPLFAFIHGGYWMRNSKETFACLAHGPMSEGFDVAMIGYTLAPDATLTQIVGEMQDAVRWLRREGPRHGVARGRLIVSGWSAGGQLAALAMALPEVDAALPISGIFDVEPCRLNYINDTVKMTREEAAAMSPLLHLPSRAGPLTAAFGASELPELQRQSRDYVDAWNRAGLSGTALALPGHDHFSIIEELAAPGGALVVALTALLARID